MRSEIGIKTDIVLLTQQKLTSNLSEARLIDIKIRGLERELSEVKGKIMHNSVWERVKEKDDK